MTGSRKESLKAFVETGPFVPGRERGWNGVELALSFAKLLYPREDS